MKCKNELRSEMIEIRDDIEDKDIKSNSIYNNILSIANFRKAKVVSIYVSFSNEVDTSRLIDYCLRHNVTVCEPIVFMNDLVATKIVRFNTEKRVAKYSDIVPISDIECFVVPGIAFDTDKNRLGYGKGYYDRYLGKSSILATKIGLCYDKQFLINKIPIEEHDIKMNYIVTEKRVF